MRIAIIGTGKIARTFGTAVAFNGVEVKFVLGRDFIRTKQFADALSATFSTDIADLPQDLDVYLCCVNDDAISEIAGDFPFSLADDQSIIHFSGSIPSTILAPVSTNYGVIWPIQSMHEVDDWQDATVAVTASNDTAYGIILQLLRQMTANIINASDQQRLRMHLVAVMLNNFVYFIFECTHDFCIKNNIELSNYRKIMQATFQSILEGNVGKLTGPARRGDLSTIRSHIQILSSDPDLLALYTCITENILKRYENIR